MKLRFLNSLGENSAFQLCHTPGFFATFLKFSFPPADLRGFSETLAICQLNYLGEAKVGKSGIRGFIGLTACK